MSMTKKDFIALADHIREHNQQPHERVFESDHLAVIADFLGKENPQFNHKLWMEYAGLESNRISPTHKK